MGKALITNRIYLDSLSKSQLDNITKRLTYKIPKSFVPTSKNYTVSPVDIIRNYKVLPKGILSIPQTRLDLIPEDYEVIDKRVNVITEFPEPKHTLFDNQQEIYDKVIDSCIINALPGWGKTYTALQISRKLQQKTLVITHTLFLRDQWKNSIKDLYGIECGIIGSGKLDYKDYPIVVSNTQTLIKHADKITKEFGLVIADEAHHCPSTTFTSILDSLHSRYKIGLSGTLKRKDGRHILFNDYFGSQIYTPPVANTLIPAIKLVNSAFSTDSNLKWADRVTKLLSDDNYKNYIANISKGLMDRGHCVLILSDRVEFSEDITTLIGEKCVTINGKTKDREQIGSKVLYGHYDAISAIKQIFSEGISINRLSCVILASPINNDSLLEQIIGRVMRPYEGKLDPIVIDIQLSGWSDKTQNDSRIGFYMRKGWEVESI